MQEKSLSYQKESDPLLETVYLELRKIAQGKLIREKAHHTLQPTALVHEAWLRLGGDNQPKWQNRAHFFGSAAEAMRRILIERARKRMVRNSSGLANPVELVESQIEGMAPDQEILAVHEGLDQLSRIDPQAAQLVKLKYFTGMSMPQVAETLELSQRQCERLWTFAKAWLRDAMKH